MDIEFIRKYCLSFPGVQEMIQWGSSLLFKVGGKIFVMYNLDESDDNKVSLKCSPEKFREMIEEEGVIPAPYLARNNWICLQEGNKLRISLIKSLIEGSYKLVFNRLPRRIKQEIGNF